MLERVGLSSDKASASQRSDFRERSSLHDAAMSWAEERFGLLSDVPARQFSRAEQYLIERQAARARLLEPRRWAPALVLAISIGAAFLGLQTSPDLSESSSSVSPIAAAKRIETKNAQRQVILADGTTVWLDWHTRLTVSMTEQQRLVVIETGRAFFDVSTQPLRPFIVEAQALTTEVTGTEFVVDVRPKQVAGVTVFEGSVNVSALDSTIALGAGEVARVRASTLVSEASTVGDQNLAWRDGRLVLRDTGLAEAFERLGPYTSYRIDVSQIESMRARISGTYFLTRANDAIQGLIQTHRLQVRQDGSLITLFPPAVERPEFLNEL